MIRKASEEKFSFVIVQKQLRPSAAPTDDSHVHALRDDWTLAPEDVDPGMNPSGEWRVQTLFLE